jgi:hypothetical protein
MSIPSPDDNPFGEEKQLREDIHAAIDKALDQVLDHRDRELTKLEAEKLAFFAIEDLGLDLTYSWYIAGANTAAGYSPTENDPTVDPSGPTGPAGPNNRGRQTTEFGSLSAQDNRKTPPKEYVEFFESNTFFEDYDLKEIWFTDRHEFLKDFYSEFAPERYRELYITSSEIRKNLQNLDDTLTRRNNSTTLADFDAGGTNALLAQSTEREIRYLISDLHIGLTETDRVGQTQSKVTAGTDLIERVLYNLTQLESLSTKQRRLINQLSNFFFHCVWKYPALAISVETVEGPNSRLLKLQHLQEFDGFEQTVEQRLKQFTKSCRDSDLLPSVSNLSSSNIDERDGIIFKDE